MIHMAPTREAGGDRMRCGRDGLGRDGKESGREGWMGGKVAGCGLVSGANFASLGDASFHYPRHISNGKKTVLFPQHMWQFFLLLIFMLLAVHAVSLHHVLI
ncbi:hypothetical protein E2C01_004873 [Portunus trituberculatus]|uniref:Uncharacterized protein n=1 Tax=Portunus trituberculatus TaxID=210409 RepID=A0A5B7CU49_PORTR|nr:hypothetical protein [Portunus trituberculatus]